MFGSQVATICHTCLMLGAQNICHTSLSLRESCHIFLGHGRVRPNLLEDNITTLCGGNQIVAKVGQTCLTTIPPNLFFLRLPYCLTV
jgi:hypothetical protein